MQHDSGVENYYDANTRWFLRFGGAAASGTVHRQLWGPGVASADEAARYIHRLLADAIEAERLAAPAVLDLGCGVGGTLLDLGDRLPALTGCGVTLSEAQVRHARAAAARRDGRCRFERGNFESLRLGRRFDVVLAIEACVHSAAPDRFFATAAAHLAPGGLLVVIDDFLVAGASAPGGPAESARSAGAKALQSAAKRLAEDFRRGWRAPGFTTVDAAVANARRAGLDAVGQRDLTSLIRLNRPRDRLVAVVAPVLDRLGLDRRPYAANLIGGAALTAGLRRGVFAYRWLAFRRAAAAG